MNEEIEALNYIEEYMEFSKFTNDSMRDYLLSEGYVTQYEETVLITKKGQKLLSNQKQNNNLDNLEEIDDYYTEELYGNDLSDLRYLIKKETYND